MAAKAQPHGPVPREKSVPACRSECRIPNPTQLRSLGLQVGDSICGAGKVAAVADIMSSKRQHSCLGRICLETETALAVVTSRIEVVTSLAKRFPGQVL